MSDPRKLFHDLSFDETHYIENRASVADLFETGHRCGIYILRFSTGEYYVGQAVDVSRRYVQHRKSHTDILEISFREFAQDDLDDVEQNIIGKFERHGIQLRNIALTSIPKGESDFDLIMTEGDQNRWLADAKYIDLAGERLVEPNLRKKYERKFERFSQLEQSELVISVLKEYVQRTLPAVKRGEISFWGSSCLPSYKNPAVRIYSRINIFWQEVLTISNSNGKIFSSWHCARTPLEAAYESYLWRLRLKYPDVLIDDQRYSPGGQDQVHLKVNNINLAHKLLQDENILRAMRLFNYRLMKKGPCNFSRNHCLSLADRLVEE